MVEDGGERGCNRLFCRWLLASSQVHGHVQSSVRSRRDKVAGDVKPSLLVLLLYPGPPDTHGASAKTRMPQARAPPAHLALQRKHPLVHSSTW